MRKSRPPRGGRLRLTWPVMACLVLGAVLPVWMVIQTVTGPPTLTPLRPGEPIDAAFTGLTDTRGASAQESAFQARYRLVTFGFTTCPEVCPLTLLGIHQALEQLGPDASRIVPVFVSIDPQRDTPQALSAYVGSFDSRIIALRGSPEAVKRVAERYRVTVSARGREDQLKSADVAHTAVVLLIDPQRRVMASIDANSTPADIAAGIVRAVRAHPLGPTPST